MNPAYDSGYKRCSCFWGEGPSSIVKRLVSIGPVAGMNVLDIGAGEGKNAYYLAALGAAVTAVEISPWAVANGVASFGNRANVRWLLGDAIRLPFRKTRFDVVVAYGLLHCLRDVAEVYRTIRTFQELTENGGYNVICAFNARSHDLSAHDGFKPTLLNHFEFLKPYDGWDVLHNSDTDLFETHPHNNIPHHHSLTRLLFRKP